MKKLLLAVLLLIPAPVLAESEFTVFSDANVSVGNTSTVVLAENGKRRVLILTNDSDTTIYCRFGQAAVLNRGIRLNAAGGSLLLDISIVRLAVNCISSVAGKNILVVDGQQ